MIAMPEIPVELITAAILVALAALLVFFGRSPIVANKGFPYIVAAALAALGIGIFIARYSKGKRSDFAEKEKEIDDLKAKLAALGIECEKADARVDEAYAALDRVRAANARVIAEAEATSAKKRKELDEMSDMELLTQFSISVPARAGGNRP